MAVDEDTLMRSAVKLPVFNGKQKEFALWWIQRGAYGTAHRFREALKETIEADMPTLETVVIDKSTAEGK